MLYAAIHRAIADKNYQRQQAIITVIILGVLGTLVAMSTAVCKKLREANQDEDTLSPK